MTSRPILFTGAMVRAILAGTKTQTRRVVKPQPHPIGKTGSMFMPSGALVASDWAWPSGVHGCTTISCKPNGPAGWAEEHSPFGRPGDRLWVRETWACLGNEDGHPINAAGQLCEEREAERFYRADVECYEYGMAKMPGARHFDGRWTPSIHMPRWASRITLEVTGVRVERLNEISEEDAKAEGVGRLFGSDTEAFAGCTVGTPYRCGYAALWESINGPGSWAANPWVWVVEFGRVAQ